MSQPKIYCFDTGFISFERGWQDLRPEDRGILWEHIVLETLQAIASVREIQFWRDKEQREIDFVLPVGSAVSHTVECKWSRGSFNPKNLNVYRALYPKGKNFVVSPNTKEHYARKIGALNVVFCSPAHLSELLHSL